MRFPCWPFRPFPKTICSLSVLAAIAISLSSPFSAPAQTVLQPGDLAVVGVNANNAACSGIAEDFISFVCFKDIAPNTVIDITDNGWERLLAGRWGNSEGFISATRTGAPIPAGTIITFRLPPIGSADYRATAPDTNWAFVKKSFNPLNLNSGGEQFYFLQGGIWDDSNDGFNFDHDATYTGGRVLFAFNTKSTWNRLSNSAQDSGLHPDVAACFHMEPGSGATDFISYSGPLTATTQLEWITRIGNPANWTAFAGCSAYQTPPSPLNLAPSGISLSCRTCSGCAPLKEVLTIRLPQSGGPFIVEYANGTDTIRRTNVSDRDTFQITISRTTSFSLVSVTDARSCPVYSNLGGSITVAVQSLQTSSLIAPLRACSPAGSQATFNLTRADAQLLAGLSGYRVNWYTDSQLNNRITQPQNYTSGIDTVFAVVTNDTCTSPPVPVPLEFADPPTVKIPLGGRLCSGEPCLPLDFQLTGSAPFTLSYTLEKPGGITETGQQVMNNANFQWNICPAQSNVAAGDMLFRFSRLTDANGCVTDLNQNMVVRVGRDAVNLINPTLCSGGRLEIAGANYDLRNPKDTIVLPGASALGCDSIIIVDLKFSDDIGAAFEGDSLICPGETSQLTLRLKGGNSFRVIYREGGDIREITGVKNGTVLNIKPLTTTAYTLLSVRAEDSGCEARMNQTFVVKINNLRLSPRPILRFGGVAISCKGAANGGAVAAIQGGFPPYRVAWSNGDTTAQITKLNAGIYQVTVTDADGCRVESAVSINEPDSIRLDLEARPPLCPNDESKLLIKNIRGGTPPFEYSLDGRFFQVISQIPLTLRNLPAGSYTLRLQDANDCTTEQAFEVPAPDAVFADLGPDRSLSAGDSLTLSAKLNFTPVRVSWIPDVPRQAGDSLSIVVKPAKTTVYRIIAQSPEGCQATDEVTVTVANQQRYYAPTAFSPNQDNLNDRFMIFGGTEVQRIVALRIYNRWGNLVYEASDLAPGEVERGWDGQFKGKAATPGVYIFQAELQLSDGKRESATGDFLLVR